MPISSKCLAGPIPDNINNCGELNTPPQSMTSRLASARTVAPRCTNSTPVARVPRSVTLVARASVRSVRLGRCSTGFRYAFDADALRPFQIVHWLSPKPTGSAPFGSSVTGHPAS